MGSCIYPQTGSGGSIRVEKFRQKMPISPIFSGNENSYESNVLVCLSKVLINLFLAPIYIEQVSMASFFPFLAMSEHAK